MANVLIHMSSFRKTKDNDKLYEQYPLRL